MTLHRTSAFLPKFIDIGLLACLSLGALYASARSGLIPSDPAQGVAVVFAPWTAADQALTRSVGTGGRFVRYGGFPFIAIVMPDDAQYSQRMLHDGAWLVVDPQVLAACSAVLSAVRNAS